MKKSNNNPAAVNAEQGKNTSPAGKGAIPATAESAAGTAKLPQNPLFSHCHSSDNGKTVKIFLLPVALLKPHPDLVGFPKLRDQDYERLAADIAARGIQDPIRITSKNLILDGHHRAKIAKEIDPTCDVPVLIDDESSPFEIALASAAARRQVNASIVALIIYENEPALRFARAECKRKDLPLDYLNGKHAETATAKAARYQIPRQYLSYCATLERFENTPECRAAIARGVTGLTWAELRAEILSAEKQLPQLYAGVTGRAATKKNPREDRTPFQIAERTLKHTLVDHLTCFSDWKKEERNSIIEQFCASLKRLPAGFRDAVVTQIRSRKFLNGAGTEAESPSTKPT